MKEGRKERENSPKIGGQVNCLEGEERSSFIHSVFDESWGKLSLITFWKAAPFSFFLSFFLYLSFLFFLSLDS